jgi:hypothetical protein
MNLAGSLSILNIARQWIDLPGGSDHDRGYRSCRGAPFAYRRPRDTPVENGSDDLMNTLDKSFGSAIPVRSSPIPG